MAISKKGIFFTFAAIALALIIILSFKAYKTYEMKEKIDIVGVRIDTMNNFIKDIEQDLEKGLYIASFRAFAGMGEYIASNGTYIADIDEGFNELILEGTLNNKEISLRMNEGFLNSFTLERLFNLRSGESYYLAKCFVEAGIDIPKEVFVGVFGK